MHTEAERFWAKVDKTSSCWLWTASVNGWGYGAFVTGGRKHRHAWMAHRWAYEHLVGPLTEGRPTLDHLCRVRRCVNPAHLEAVAPRVNNLRGLGAPAINARKAYCSKGHLYTPENTIRDAKGWRRCRTCNGAWRGAEERLARRRALRAVKMAARIPEGTIPALEGARRLGIRDDSIRQPWAKVRYGVVKIGGRLYMPAASAER